MGRSRKEIVPLQVPYRTGRKSMHGLYCKIDRHIDGRTTLGKTISILKKELRAFMGEPTTASELLIGRIVYKTIKLSMYEAASFQDLKNEEADHYLPMANSLRLDLQALANMAGKPKAAPDLGSYLDANYKDKK